MINHLAADGDRVVLIGIDEKPVKGSADRFFVNVAWIRRSVWQQQLRLSDGRWIQIPEDCRNKGCSQLMRNAEFVIKSNERNHQ
jgi:hypothetical protein